MAASARCLCLRVLNAPTRSFATTCTVLAGRSWRLQHGLPCRGSEYGPLTDLPDWSYADGRPSPPMKGQIRRRKEREEFARRVVSLSSEIDNGMQRWRDGKEEEKRLEERKKSLLLKPKGKLLLKTPK
ncbi:large ribosomal subunit protein mL52 isoform X1 [Denticeps clupeoides]|uniref:Large ribosomal subunit protein mL52 n=2 Tax=Denticeps clupeoides TaxID=299321 RepID=A0AAY4A0N0_9TELE|nr:39S ribosomal protein L52, mitochondrial isoform X1 [Denticeps clupeoides]